LPLAALRLPSETVAALARLGLKRIGDILDLPRAPLVARFGADLLRQLDCALGREDEPLAPRLPVAPYVAERSFHEPIAREEDVLATIERLAARLKTALAARGDGARRLEVALFRTDGAVKRIAAGTSRPIRDPQAIRALFVERLAALGDEVDPGFGFDLARLSVLTAEPCPDEQIGLGGHEDQAELDRLVDRLSARLGRRRVARLVAHDSHSPELAARAHPAQDMAHMAQALARAALAGEASGQRGNSISARAGHSPELGSSARAALASEASGQRGNSISARAGHSPELGSSARAELGWEAWRRFRIEVDLSPRPLRLLARPEPIQDVFALVPDGPPVRFRWRRAMHEVVASEGPERIEGAWWSEDGGPARDYFRVEDKAGLRFWLFRAGLYRDRAVPRWFLHGMYT
jgi:protein ImuB